MPTVQPTLEATLELMVVSVLEGVAGRVGVQWEVRIGLIMPWSALVHIVVLLVMSSRPLVLLPVIGMVTLMFRPFVLV